MNQPKYCTAFIVWSDSKKEYVEKNTNGTVGIDAILNSYSANGWDLVTVVVENSSPLGMFPTPSAEYYTSGYRAIFTKR